MARTVVDPQGERWDVARQWAPWRPRVRRRRKGRDGDSGWADLTQGAGGVDDAGALLVGIGLAVLAVVAFVVVWPVVAVAIELTLIGLGALVATAGRVVLRRPWTVRAVSARGEERVWRRAGWRASSRLVDEVAAALESGAGSP